MSNKIISLENFSDRKKHGAILNSPRSLEACKRQGIIPEELIFRSQEEFRKTQKDSKSVENSVLKVRYEHMELRRTEKIRILKEEREQLIEEENQGLIDFKGRTEQSKSIQGNSYLRASAGSPTTNRSAMFLSRGGEVDVPSDSAMIEREKKQLEKLKLKQQMDLQQMMEYELKMQQIREQNENKMIKQKLLEDQKQQELLRKQRKAEEEKRQKEIMNTKKKEKEAELARRRQEELNQEEKEKAEKERLNRLEQQKLNKIKEEEQKKKQEQFKTQLENIQRGHMLQARHKKLEIDSRDAQRKLAIEKKKDEVKSAHEDKRRMKQRKLEDARLRNERINMDTRRQFEYKQKKVEDQRIKFDEHRHKTNEILQEKRYEKAEQIKLVIKENIKIEESKKNEYINKRLEAEDRQKVLEKDKKGRLEEKRKDERENDKYRLKVRRNNAIQEEEHKNIIMDNIDNRNIRVETGQKSRVKERKHKAELDALKRSDREETVKRINRMNEFQKEKVLERIQFENEKARNLQFQKESLLETRKKLKKDVELQKNKVMAEFEKMKKKGKINKEVLKEMGFEIDQSKPSPVKSASREPSPHSNRKFQNAVPKKEEDRRKSVDGGQRGLKNSSSNRLQPIRRNEISEEEALEIVQKLRTRQHQDLLNLLEMEQENEITREELLNNCNTKNEKNKLEIGFGKERARASERIMKLSDDHEKELQAALLKYGLIEIINENKRREADLI